MAHERATVSAAVTAPETSWTWRDWELLFLTDHDGDNRHPRWIKCRIVLVDTADFLSVQEKLLKLSNLRQRNSTNHDHDGGNCHPRWIKCRIVSVGTADFLSV